MQSLLHILFVGILFFKSLIALSVEPGKQDSLQKNPPFQVSMLKLQDDISVNEIYAAKDLELHVLEGESLNLACQLNVYDFSIQYNRSNYSISFTTENFLYQEWDKMLIKEDSTGDGPEPLDDLQIVSGTPVTFKLIIGFNF